MPQIEGNLIQSLRFFYMTQTARFTCRTDGPCGIDL